METGEWPGGVEAQAPVVKGFSIPEAPISIEAIAVRPRHGAGA